VTNWRNRPIGGGPTWPKRTSAAIVTRSRERGCRARRALPSVEKS